MKWWKTQFPDTVKVAEIILYKSGDFENFQIIVR